MLDRLAELLGEMTPETLYFALGIISFIEAIFPPVPADVVVALGAFLAARSGAGLIPTILVVVGAMSAGSVVSYWLGRRFGAVWMHRQLKRLGVDTAERQFEALYGRYGLSALFLARFVPGLRMFVAPVAGMLRIPLVPTIVLITIASFIWYGFIATLAFRVGTDWEAFKAAIETLVARVGLTAAAFCGLALVVGWAVWRRRKFRRQMLKAQDEAGAGPP